MTPTTFLLAPLALMICPAAAQAHDAFGDLGPFYMNLMHPMVDPAQGLLIAGAAVLLARQPLETVRPAYVVLVLAGVISVCLTAIVVLDGLTLRITGLGAAALGLLAALGRKPGPWVTSTIVAIAAVGAGLAISPAGGLRGTSLSIVGGAAGIALSALLIWGMVDAAQRRISPVAGAVAGAWIAAIGVMAAALPS